MSDTSFERMLLADSVKAAKALGADVKSAWVHHTLNQWEFHYGDFYWWGRAENAYHARAKGWDAWIEKQNAASSNGKTAGAQRAFKLTCANNGSIPLAATPLKEVA